MDIPERTVIEPGFEVINEANVFTVQSHLGQGGFGTVYLVYDQHNNPFALKLCELWKMKPNDYDQINDRFKVGFEAGKTVSDHIVRNLFYGKIKGNPYIIMEYCPNGCLGDQKDAFHYFDKYNVLGIQLLLGLKSLHEQGIIHRDVKPENVLFDANNVAKMSDFDIVGRVANRMTAVSWLGVTKEVWGTALYAPPEQLNNRNAYHALKPCIDMFAFGVMMYEIISGGFFPYGDFGSFQENPVRYYEKIRKGEFTPIRIHRPDIDSTWADIIEHCIQPDPKNRLATPNDALQKLGISAAVATPVNISNTNAWAIKIQVGDEINRWYDLNKLSESLNKSALTVGWYDGTSPNNDIDILEKHSSYISTQHATLIKDENNWKIRDGQQLPNGSWKHSLNGTYVNGIELSNGQEVVLSNSDIILIGEVTLQVVNY